MITEKYSMVSCQRERNSDIVFAEFPNRLRIDLAAAKEIVSNRLDFMKSKKHYLVVDISNVRQVSSEAKEFMQRADTGLKDLLGAAFIATNPVAAMIANIFIKTPKNFQAEFFGNKEDAYNWIIAQRTRSSVIDLR
jgi:hypothetical protein